MVEGDVCRCERVNYSKRMNDMKHNLSVMMKIMERREREGG